MTPVPWLAKPFGAPTPTVDEREYGTARDDGAWECECWVNGAPWIHQADDEYCKDCDRWRPK